MILLPKYYGIEARDNMGIRARFKGEYRAILHNPEQGIKYDSGWKPNRVLDQGFNYMARSYASLFRSEAIGDSATPVADTQTGIQGNVYYSTGSNYSADSTSVISHVNSGAPHYASIDTRSYTWDAGPLSTGLINEFCFIGKNFNDSPAGDPALDGTIRVVLDTTINKGPADYLTIEHRMTTYPELNDITGVISISGVPYNYLMRGVNIDAMTYRPDTAWWGTGYSGDQDDLTDHFGIGPSVGGTDTVTPSANFYPDGLNTYVKGTYTASVDRWNKDIRTFRLTNSGMNSSHQIRIGKVSDDTPHEKFNTHEFVIAINMYPQRYTP